MCALGKSVVLSSPLVLAGRKDRVQCKAGVQHRLCYARDCTVVGETERTDLGKESSDYGSIASVAQASSYFSERASYTKDKFHVILLRN